MSLSAFTKKELQDELDRRLQKEKEHQRFEREERLELYRNNISVIEQLLPAHRGSSCYRIKNNIPTPGDSPYSCPRCYLATVSDNEEPSTVHLVANFYLERISDEED